MAYEPARRRSIGLDSGVFTVYNAVMASAVQLSNKELVGRGLGLMGAALRPYVETALKTEYGDDWLGRIERRKLHPPDLPIREAFADPLFALQVIEVEWNPVFARRLRRSDRSWVGVVKHARHAWAHRPVEEFDLASTRRFLDSMYVVTAAVGAHDEARRIALLLEDLQQGEHAAEDPARQSAVTGEIRSLLIQVAANRATFAIAIERGRKVGRGRRDVENAALGLRGSGLLRFDDPLTDATQIELT